jgi:hypothetical protein
MTLFGFLHVLSLDIYVMLSIYIQCLWHLCMAVHIHTPVGLFKGIVFIDMIILIVL